MASADAYDLIEGYLKGEFAGTPLAFENDGFSPPADPDYFVLIEIVGNLLNQASIGAEDPRANLWREDGIIFAHVMAPRGSGSRQARVYATQICDLFRGLELGGIVFHDMSIGAGEGGNTDGSYYRLTATIDWQRDI